MTALALAGLLGCAGPFVGHRNDDLAAARAEQFVEAIAVQRDARYAFDLLTVPARSALEQDWDDVVAALQGDLMPERVRTVAVEPSALGVVPVYVEGRAQGQKVYWRVDVAANEGYFVHDAEPLHTLPTSGRLRQYVAPGPSAEVREAPPGARVYFVPVDADPALVERLAGHYAERLHLATEVLPPVKVDLASVNQSRQQLIAEEVANAVAHRFSNVLAQPASTMVAVTSRDMYIREYSWAFAMSYRLRPNVALVSFARMDPRALGAGDNRGLLQARLQKMVAKNIGLLTYGLASTSNPRSLLFNSVLSVQDLDIMNGDYRYAGMRAF